MTLGSLSLSHSANLIRSCIFSSVSLSILANSADISSILFFKSRISFYLFFNLSSCSFLVCEISSLFFSKSSSKYSTHLLFRRECDPTIRVHHYTLFAFACIDESLQILVTFWVHNRYHFLFLGFEIPLEVHYSLFYLVFAGSIFICGFLLDDLMMSWVPRWVWRSWTLLLRIWTLSASSSGPSPG